MSDVVYTTGRPEQWDDIIDFANYVFSQAHQPHDFKTLIPGVYGQNEPEQASWHFIAVRDGRIRALVADKPEVLTCPGGELRVGCVGTVSVHPYSRGEGHMKRLMADMIADAKKNDYDILMLGGQRQRYNYFGFEQGGWSYNYSITAVNVRHCLGGVDDSGITVTDLTDDRPEEVDYAFELAHRQPVHGLRPRRKFLACLGNWRSPVRLIRCKGEMAGYIVGGGSEIALEREELLYPMIKKLFSAGIVTRLDIPCAPYETERIAYLSAISGGRTINDVEMINVLNWRRVIACLLRARQTFCPLEDGVFTLAVDDEPSLTIRVTGGQVSVAEEGLAPDLKADHLTMQRRLFDIEWLSLPGAYKNWFPLPFYTTTVDTF